MIGLENANPAFMLRWQKALAGVRQGLADATVAVDGDSITSGCFDNGIQNGIYSASFPWLIAQILTNRYGIDASPQSRFCDNNLTREGMSLATYDTRLSLGAWANVYGSPANNGPGGVQFYTNGPGAPLAFKPTIPTDKIEYFYADGANVGSAASFTLDADGVSPAPYSVGHATTNLLNASLTTTLGMHTYNVTGVSDMLNGSGFIASNSAIKSVKVLGLGACGWTSGDWNNPSNGYGPLNGLVALAPDLTISIIGVNDILQGISLENYYTNRQALITAAKISGDVVVGYAPQIDPTQTGASIATQAQFKAIARQLAYDNCCPFWDMGERIVDYAAASAGGYMGDQNHPNGYWHQVIAHDGARAIANGFC